MKKLIVLLSLMCALYAAAITGNETVKYRVMYKWGLINKQAGTAVLSIREDGDRYYTRLTARSESWADRFFSVRDTLNGIILKEGFRPSFYEKIAHEGGEHKHDVVRFSYNGDQVTGTCTRRVVKKGRENVNQSLTLQSLGMTVDMLSSFYYMRSLPFQDWNSGYGHDVTIFSGKRKETLSFKYKGRETVDVDGHKYDCYHITFIFTGDGGKKTSDDMDAWITTDSRRLPVKLEGKLPVGKVRCFLMS